MELRHVMMLAVLAGLLLQFSGLVKRDLVPLAALMVGAAMVSW